jgi:DnaJ-class molecular chaperone
MLICYWASEDCQINGCKRVRQNSNIGYGHAEILPERYAMPELPLKNPHKCPNCEGFGNRYNEDKTQVGICQSCDGKGIVWG